jgi:hypothetical protein
MDPHALTALLESVTDFAKLMVGKAGEFYPFGGFLSADGRVNQLAVHDGQEHPDRHDVYRQMEDALRKRVTIGEASAIALVADVNIPAAYRPPFPDGIRVLVEASGYSRFFYLPYSRPRRGFLSLGRKSEPTYGDFISVDVPPTFFASRADAQGTES